MYQVSVDYQTAAKSPVVVHYLRGKIGTFNFDESAVVDGSFSMSRQICDSSKIKFGGVFVGQLSATFIPSIVGAAIPRGSWLGKVISFDIGTELEDSTIEWVPGGVFTVSEVNHTREGIEVIAYDDMTKFDRRYTGRVFRGSLSLVMAQLCAYLGVNLNLSDSDFEDHYGSCELSLDNNFETWRDYLSALLESRALYSFIDRSGSLVVRTWRDFVGTTPGTGRTTYELTKSDRFDNISVSDWNTVISGASYTNQETGEIIILGTQSDDYSFYEFGSNPFMQDTYGLDRFTEIFNNIIQYINVIPYSVETNSEIALDIADMLYLPDGLGGYITSPVMAIEYTYRHSTVYYCYGENPAKSSSSSTGGSSGGSSAAAIGNKIAFYYGESQSSFDIETSDRQIVNTIEFLADTDSEANTWTEIKGTVSKDDPNAPVTVRVVYIYDDNQIAYSPEFTFDENGYQTLSLNYFIDYIDPSIGHTWDVALEVSGGSFQIDNHEVHTLIWGQGLSKVDKWDGKIKISEELALYLLKYQPEILKALTDSYQVNLVSFENPTASDIMGGYPYEPYNFGLTADYVIISVGEPDINNIFFAGEDFAGDPISTGLI